MTRLPVVSGKRRNRGRVQGGVQSPRPKVQSPKSKVQSPKSKVQGPRSKVQGPRSKVQSPAIENEEERRAGACRRSAAVSKTSRRSSVCTEHSAEVEGAGYLDLS